MRWGRRHFMVVCAIAASVTLAPTPLEAQHLATMRVGVGQAAPAVSSPHVAPRLALTVTRPPRRWPYIVTGAVLGAATTAVVFAGMIEQSGDPPVGLSPALVAIVVGSGATVGALGGWAISSIVRAVRA